MSSPRLKISKLEYWVYYPKKEKKELLDCIKEGGPQLLYGPYRDGDFSRTFAKEMHILIEVNHEHIFVPEQDIINIEYE